MTGPLLLPDYEVVQVANPAAGAEFTLTVPGDGDVQLISLAFTLTTSAAVANRRVVLLADNQSDIWSVCPAAGDQAASLATRYGAFVGAPSNAFGALAATIPLPGPAFILPAGHRLRSSTFAIDAGDQYSLIRALWRKFPTGHGQAWRAGPAPYLTEGQ